MVQIAIAYEQKEYEMWLLGAKEIVNQWFFI
jgi:hypothetical protein